jgi:uncharacterized protein (DUF924 family)
VKDTEVDNWDISADDILQFWFEDIDHSCWFKKNPEFDRELERRFGDVLALAKNDQLNHWCDTPRGYLALIVVLDQFSRNIYRESARAFEADPKALQLTLEGIEKGLDEKLTLEQRSFFYLPLRHAENLAMQELGLAKTRVLNDAGYGTDKYALNHLELIERFGRFPHRNSILGRGNTVEEELYLEDGTAGF